MAGESANIASARWKTAYADYQQKLAACSAAMEPEQMFAATERVLAARTALLLRPSPSMSALAEKLSVLFEDEQGHTEESMNRVRALGDARRLTFELMNLICS